MNPMTPPRDVIENDSSIRYNYTQFSQDKHVNVIPDHDFKRLVSDTFSTMTQILRSTYGPYGSVVVISDQNETTTTKDGYNVCEAMGFSHMYKRMVYLAIKKICDRVNRNVGDGTTSCILLAEKIFNKLDANIKTPDDKRNVLHVLSQIETHLQDSEMLKADMENGFIKPFTINAFENIINLAGNYDGDLAKFLLEAFYPAYDTDGVVTSIRSVIPDGVVDRSIGSDISYSVSYMPGDYRVRVNINPEVGLMFAEPTDIRVVVYDHVFNSSDWDNFMANYDKETPTIIIATGFNAMFKDNDYVRYCSKRALTHAPLTVFICAIDGSFLQDEVADLCAVINTTARTLTDISPVDHDMLPLVNMQIFKGNAMCFIGTTPPLQHIKLIEYDMENDTSKSIVRKQHYQDRIDALMMTKNDTLVTVKASSSLELKMIMDKIDDCTSIVQSAVKYGIVPNILKYAAERTYRLSVYGNEYSEIHNSVFGSQNYNGFGRKVADLIHDSITELFKDIWLSKWGSTDDVMSTLNRFYNEYADKDGSIDYATSYDIITDQFVDCVELPTSAQYDMEVVAAAISIVKYLITSRALIFDAHLQKPVDDISSVGRL